MSCPEESMQTENRSMLGVLACFSIFEMCSVTKTNLGRRALFQLNSQGRILSRGHGGLLLTVFLSMAYRACFLIQPNTTYPQAVPHTLAWALSYQ